MAEMTVGQRLKRLRGEKTQAEIASLVGVTESAIKMYEADERVPRDCIKVRIANLYGLTVGSLFFGE